MNKIMYHTSIIFLLLSLNIYAKNYLDENLHKMNWNGIDVIWLEDNALPTYDVSIYFAEGALGDEKEYEGETELMFSQLTSGTHRFPQKGIIESLEFFGVEHGSRVTHEYSTFTVSGMVKDFTPTMKMVCHLFEDAIFPADELKKAKSRIIAGMKSVVSNHSALASRAFRYESLLNSGFENATSGDLASIKKMTTDRLLNRLKYFNEKALKRIYIKGPKDIMQLEAIVKNDCNWNGKAQIRSIPVVKDYRKINKIIFVPVDKANQAQVRIGRIMHTQEIKNEIQDLKTFASDFLGSGFTSRLFQKLRVEKGLTYSVSSYVSDQSHYGRSGISTFTKNESVVDILKAIKEVLETAKISIDPMAFALAKKSIKGNYLIGLESTSGFLENLLHFDHISRAYTDIYKFTENINKITMDDLKKMIDTIFGMDKQTILILGNKKIIADLKKAGFDVQVEKASKYL